MKVPKSGLFLPVRKPRKPRMHRREGGNSDLDDGKPAAFHCIG